MTLGRIMEVCYLVADMDKAVAHWTTVMGVGPFFVADMSAMPPSDDPEVRAMPIVMAFAYSGDQIIELVQPVGEADSIFHNFLKERGQGYHHIMVEADYDHACEILGDAGYEKCFSSKIPTGERFAFFDTRRDQGGYVEIMDLSPGFLGMMAKIRQAAESWDGETEPSRLLFDLL